ncbi:SdpI family protein [Chitinophaga sp. 22321]|uniref:SdpI family protein n=1 Tax=Chitinophaga hostae TaxID=2831022 RepID=A0ABS5J9I9_9BACT|nr:SdpI family protein [Chitinophaga hostae]MBS0031879.1 SdpI family protein [Chitinophaga hostae]
MKENKWLKEIPLIVLMLCPLGVYWYLKPLLPELLPSHYTIDQNGHWVVDGRMSPIGLVGGMLLVSVVIYLLLHLALVVKKWQPAIQQQSALLEPVMYMVKAGLVLLFTAIPVYTMLTGAGKLQGGAVWGYIGSIVLLILLNWFIYRLYSVMYRNSDDKPLSHQHYVIIWVGTHIVVSLAPLCALLLAGKVDFGRMIPQFILVFLAVCGNLMYNVRPNTYMGIRTPWTLKNETVWRKTHRLGGVVMFVLGTAGFIATLLVNEQWAHIILLLVLIVSTLISTVYSYVIYKKLIHQS